MDKRASGDLMDELRDRYGPLPGETENLFEIMRLKFKMKAFMITRLEQGRDMLVFSFHEKTPVPPDKILSIIKGQNNIRFTPDARLMAPLASGTAHSPQAILHTADEILTSLAAGTA